MNMHGVNFKLVKHADKDFRVEFWQGDVFYTSKEFRTQAAASTYIRIVKDEATAAATTIASVFVR